MAVKKNILTSGKCKMAVGSEQFGAQLMFTGSVVLIVKASLFFFFC